MPARHTSLQDIPLLEAVSNPAALVDERGCRRDIRSNGWIVLSKELALHENRSGRRNQFSSFGADLWSAISPGSKPAMKSGPDVFADALVPLPWLGPARQILKISQSKLSPSTAAVPQGPAATPVVRGLPGCRYRAPARGPIAANGYRFAKRQGKPNCRIRQ
jgi:hypothetical protein